jgi:hypothetical protein
MATIPNNAGQAIALDAKTGRATQTARTVYLACLTAAPTATTTLATMSEVTTAGYSRQAVTWTAPSGNPRVTSNSNAVTFGPFSADPPSVGWVALVSAASGTVGDLIDAWAVDTARDGIPGDSLVVAAGALTLSQT